MVRHLPAPVRPLRGGRTWTWRPRERWIRIFHRDDLTPDGSARRRFGPLLRFDPHTPPAGAPAACPAGRSVMYAAKHLRTAGAEVFGDTGEASVCPHFHAAVLRPSRAIVLQDVQANGSMLLGALPALGSADLPRAETQAWARAICEDLPGGPEVAGIRYTSAHDEGPSAAIWDAAPDLVVVRDIELCDPALFLEFSYVMKQVAIPVREIGALDCEYCRRARSRGYTC